MEGLEIFGGEILGTGLEIREGENLWIGLDIRGANILGVGRDIRGAERLGIDILPPPRRLETRSESLSSSELGGVTAASGISLSSAA